MRVAVLAQQNINLVDGSTIWLLNVCKALAATPGFEVTLLSAFPLSRRTLTQELPASVTIVSPALFADVIGKRFPALPARFLGEALQVFEERLGAFDRIFVRGDRFLNRLLANPRYARRVVGYTASAMPRIGEPSPFWLAKAAEVGARLVVQSPAAKSALESLADFPARLVHVVPPRGAEPAQGVAPGGPRGALCYSGKVDLRYGMDWLLDIAEQAPADGAPSVEIIGGKDSFRRRDPEFFERFDAFRATAMAGEAPGVRLRTDLPHAEALAAMAGAGYGFCLRHEDFDDVIEISTKVVEFVTLGVPPILNDNRLHREAFGDDYPFLVNTKSGDPAAAVIAILRAADGAAWEAARRRLAEIAPRFSPEAFSRSLARAVRGAEPDAPPLARRPHRLLIATHERKFVAAFASRAAAEPNVALDFQGWSLSEAGERGRKPAIGYDAIFCEWCGANAVWHSRNKPPGARLIVRLHRFEAFRDYPRKVNWKAVDALIVVSDYFRDVMIADFGVPERIIHVFPQYIDWAELQRPKLPEARFTLGLVGINPYDHKRFDRALDFFLALHAADPRFRMAVRSAMPWTINWIWENLPEDRARFEALFARIAADPVLSRHVRFDPAGPDMEEWYRGVGFILSSSDTEGCHTSVLEGMASGALPVVRGWPGARGLFAPHVHEPLEAAVPAMIAHADAGAAERAETEAALRRRAAEYDLERFATFFFSLSTGETT